MAADKGDSGRKMHEKQVRLLGFMLEYRKSVPKKYQQRLPDELLSQLAQSLTDPTITAIIRELREVQKATEKSMFQNRLALQRQNGESKAKLNENHQAAIRECQTSMHKLPMIQASHKTEIQVLETRNEEALNNLDFKIVDDLDLLIVQQQNILTQANVPGFNVTTNPIEIKIQMFLLEFIVKLITCGMIM